jgi:hypothetical protein
MPPSSINDDESLIDRPCRATVSRNWRVSNFERTLELHHIITCHLDRDRNILQDTVFVVFDTTASHLPFLACQFQRTLREWYVSSTPVAQKVIKTDQRWGRIWIRRAATEASTAKLLQRWLSRSPSSALSKLVTHFCYDLIHRRIMLMAKYWEALKAVNHLLDWYS